MPSEPPQSDAPAGPSEFHIEVLPGDQQVLLRVHGELDLSSAPTLTSVIEGLDDSHRMVVIDLADVGFIDSTGVGAIVHARRTLESRFMTVAVMNPSERARFVFEITGLADLVITPT